jgi:DNA-directed RNA polymerase specialized sigma24 family protein
MASSGSVTEWIQQLKAGDYAAAQPLWEAYVERLVHLARKKLQGLPRRAADEHDVVQDAFKSFFGNIARGRFPQLADRHDLWPLLAVITTRKALDLIHHEQRRKRGSGGVRGESAWLNPSAASDADAGIAQVPGLEPTPEFAALMDEECRRLLDRLGQPELRSVALWKMEGHSNDEIAAKLGRSRGTVERKLKLIRQLWEEEGGV